MGLVLFLKESIVGLGQYVESLKVNRCMLVASKNINSFSLFSCTSFIF